MKCDHLRVVEFCRRKMCRDCGAIVIPKEEIIQQQEEQITALQTENEELREWSSKLKKENIELIEEVKILKKCIKAIL